MWNGTMQPAEQALWTCNAIGVTPGDHAHKLDVNSTRLFLKLSPYSVLVKWAMTERSWFQTPGREILPLENHSSKHSREKGGSEGGREERWGEGKRKKRGEEKERKQWSSVKNSDRCFRHQQAQTHQQLPITQQQISSTQCYSQLWRLSDTHLCPFESQSSRLY